MDNLSFSIKVEKKYRRVYAGATYTITWSDAAGVEHKATCHNYERIMRFANNGFSKDGLRGGYLSSIKVY